MRTFTLCMLFCLGTLVGGSVQAQPGATSPTNGITATYTESVPLKAERLRLVLLIKAKGADAKSAIVALSEHKQRVQKELEAMKADKESIEFTSTRLGGDNSDTAQMQQVQRQMQMQMGTPGAAASAAPIPTVVTAVCGLKAEWPLPNSEGDALALLPATLNDQIKARDLAGDNNKPKLSKAAQEQLEELETMVSERYSYQNSNEPTSKIQFIAAVPEEMKKKATAAAFAKATQEVDTLAQSTGQKRGKLLSLSTDSAMSSYSQMVKAYSGYYAQGDTTSATVLGKFEDTQTVSSPNADDLSVTVSVSVVYAID